MLRITVWHVLFNLVLLLVVYLLLRPAQRAPFIVNKANRKTSIFLLLIFVLFAFQDLDYLHYQQLVTEKNPYELVHLEEVYLDLLGFIDYSYFLFRLIVFGGSLLILLYTIKRLDIGFDLALFCLVATNLVVISYGRWILAFAFSFLGYSYIIKPFRFKISSYAIGVGFIIVSTLFHRSILVMTPLYFFSFFFREMNKRRAFLLIIAILMVSFIVYMYGSDILVRITEAEFLENYEAQRAVSEIDNTNRTGIGMWINNILHFSSYLLSVIIFFKVASSQSYKQWAPAYKYIGIITSMIVILSFLFLIPMGNLDTYTLFYRFIYFSSVPMALFIACCFKYNNYRRLASIVLYTSFLYQIYNISYHAYHASLGLYVAQ